MSCSIVWILINYHLSALISLRLVIISESTYLYRIYVQPLWQCSLTLLLSSNDEALAEWDNGPQWIKSQWSVLNLVQSGRYPTVDTGLRLHLSPLNRNQRRSAGPPHGAGLGTLTLCPVGRWLTREGCTFLRLLSRCRSFVVACPSWPLRRLADNRNLWKRVIHFYEY